MEKIIKNLRERAKSSSKTIVFPEANDSRIQKAIKYIKVNGIAKPLAISSKNIELDKKKEFTNIYFKLKQARGVTLDEANALMENPLYYAAMMTRCGYAAGFVAGAQFTTSAVIKAAISCLSVDRESRILSSCFIMCFPDSSYGEKGILVYADCAVIPNPSSEQLASIGISTAQFVKNILGFKPKVAFLSFSTKGSAESRWTKKVKEAVEIAQSKNSGFLIDGELQADSALIPEVASRKLGESDVAGKANVLIFPNLDAGNISYKLTERLGKARAIGPIILGTVQPCSDLSRGCSVDDIIDCAAVTAIRAQQTKQI